MEANEAPEKLYCVATEGGYYLTTNKPESPFAEAVEYTRTDAFIEKAARYLNRRLYDRVEVVNFGTVLESIMLKEEFIEDFKKYMKGE